uniref:Uncharacterized protein n=1 Tax=Oryza meridionalis TaxID=40149 RepID=A0A0E0F4H6_9ORYZ
MAAAAVRLPSPPSPSPSQIRRRGGASAAARAEGRARLLPSPSQNPSPRSGRRGRAAVGRDGGGGFSLFAESIFAGGAGTARRSAFHTICRVLRYLKRFLVMNPEQPDAAGPAVDYLDMDAQLLRRFPEWEGNGVADVPFEMYAYRVMERDKSNACRDRSSDSGSDGNSLCGDDSVSGGSSTTTTATNASASASSRPLLDRRGSTRSSPRGARWPSPPPRQASVAAALLLV